MDDITDQKDQEISREKLEIVREIVRLLAERKVSSYAETARTVGVSVDKVKSFAYGRTHLPRGDFWDLITSKLIEMRAYRFDPDITQRIEQLFDGRNSESFQLQTFGRALGLNRSDFGAAAQKYCGNYACYRYAGKSQDIYKTRLKIHDFEPHIGVLRFTLYHSTEDEKTVMTSGFAAPVDGKLCLIGRRPSEASLSVAILEHEIAEGRAFSGLFLQTNVQKNTEAARIVFVKVDEFTEQSGYGVLKFPDVSEELGFLKSVIDNEISVSDVLSTYIPR